ncbi:3-oxoacyl-ACP synthase III family protein [Lentzea jiangxiensis]|uniref:3-oxoacyl-[acyl-carrier-protein] synthase-3 n=1 Tax=Lentzea jiangxiensis TaxID=641025 RepID=A0A1H0X6R5_9PSEU|nr:ketoacyl-ACP synthase III [Lentzea jiangxiensis]SDP98146.1 3-oxoacyl-[acyl-carrier-protein] synthase-3 [Lentzea jiangxiensis]
MTDIASRVAAVSVHLPETVLSTEDLEARLAARNPDVEILHGAITKLSGVRYRHIAEPGCTTVELGIAAARKLLTEHNRSIDEIDLLIFCSVSLTLLEPATAHAVAAGLGASCHVFDVRNACNSFVTAMQVADSFIRTGTYRRVLVVAGEWTTPVMKWSFASQEDYLAACAGYTVSDAGAAMLLEASDEPGVLGAAFGADSSTWESAVVPVVQTNGTKTHQLGDFQVDGLRFARAFAEADLSIIPKTVAELGLSMSDFKVVCMHQPVDAVLTSLRDKFELREDQLVRVVSDHGNSAATCLPLQLAIAVEQGRVQRGDLVAMIGLASGFSYGVVVLKW